VLTKSIGTQNPINLVKATMEGLTSLRRPEQVAKLRGLSVNEVLGIQKQPKSTATVGANGAADPVAVVAESPPGEPEKSAEEAPKEGSNGG